MRTQQRNTELQSKAILLKKTPFRENDLFLDLLLEQEGVIRAIIFGAGSQNSSRGRRCQPFKQLSVYLKKHTDANTQKINYSIIELGELSTPYLITTQAMESEAPNHHHTILACAHYVNECYLHLANQFEHSKQAYQLYTSTLEGLQTAAQNTQIKRILRHFEMEMLSFLGYDIRHIHKQISQAPKNNTYFCYDLHEGWQVTSDAQSGLAWHTCQYLHEIEKIPPQDLKILQQHNQKLLNELSNFKIQTSRDWLKNIYSKTLSS